MIEFLISGLVNGVSAFETVVEDEHNSVSTVKGLKAKSIGVSKVRVIVLD